MKATVRLYTLSSIGVLPLFCVLLLLSNHIGLCHAASKATYHKIALRRRAVHTSFHPGSVQRLRKRSVTNDLLFSSSSILAPIEVGTPAQELYVLLDTSSSDLALFGNGYANQYQSSLHGDSDALTQGVASKPFQRSASTSYKAQNGAHFQNNYGSGDSSTYFVAEYGRDTIGFRGLALTNQPLGVIEQGNVSYGPQASGIMGLAFESASLGLHATPPVQQLVFNNALKEPVFSFALIRPSAESEQTEKADTTQPGGIFTMGLLDGDQYQGSIGWSDLVTTVSGSSAPYKWLSRLDGIMINGKLVPGTKGIVANFDTGSSVSRASTALVDSILSFANGGAFKDDDENYYVQCGKNVAPALSMTISMGGISVAIEPMDLLFKTSQFSVDGSQTPYCYSTLTTTDSEEYDIQIGDDILRSLFVAFSYNPARIGIAEQSNNVRNQGAKPDYAVTSTDRLDTATLTQPSAASTFQPVQHTPVAASMVTAHVSAIGTQKIAAGGQYAPSITPTMATVKAQSTPSAQVGTVATQAATVDDQQQGINRNPLTANGADKVVEAAGSSPSPSIGAASSSSSLFTLQTPVAVLTPIAVLVSLYTLAATL